MRKTAKRRPSPDRHPRSDKLTLKGQSQLTLDLPSPPNALRAAVSGDPPYRTIAPMGIVRSAPPVPTPIYDVYWEFAAKRQDVFFRRLAGIAPPWTTDPILSTYKFTNAYRASDRVSQFLINNVIYRTDLPSTPGEILLRVLLFKIFNNIETWTLLENAIGSVVIENFDVANLDTILTKAKNSGMSIYSGAYIMPSGPRNFLYSRKHSAHLSLLLNILTDNLSDKIEKSNSLSSVYSLLKSYPGIGPFLAFQYTIDINYSTIINFSEMDFVVAGPGAREGIRKCFSSLGDMSDEDLIRYVTDHQEEEFARRNIAFRNLWGRRLHLIDCQNLFCEVAKYSRVSHPQYSGDGRTRIKQKFKFHTDKIEYRFPPKWRLIPF